MPPLPQLYLRLMDLHVRCRRRRHHHCHCPIVGLTTYINLGKDSKSKTHQNENSTTQQTLPQKQNDDTGPIEQIQSNPFLLGQGTSLLSSTTSSSPSNQNTNDDNDNNHPSWRQWLRLQQQQQQPQQEP